MKPTTKTKSRVVVFHDGNYQFITEKQEEAIYQEGTNADKIKIDGETIYFSSIARIVSKKKFYEENPDKRPSDLKEIELPEAWNIESETPQSKLQIFAGMFSFCKSNPNADNAKNLYKQKIKTSDITHKQVEKYLQKNKTPKATKIERLQ